MAEQQIPRSDTIYPDYPAEVPLSEQIDRFRSSEKAAWARAERIEDDLKQRTRVTALEFALRASKVMTTAEYVARAEAFRAFLSGENDQTLNS